MHTILSDQIYGSSGFLLSKLESYIVDGGALTMIIVGAGLLSLMGVLFYLIWIKLRGKRGSDQ